MRVLLMDISGETPRYLYLSQADTTTCMGEFFADSAGASLLDPSEFSLQESSFETIDAAVESFATQVNQATDRGFKKTRLTASLQSQIEGRSAVEDSLVLKIPSLAREDIAAAHALLTPIFGVWGASTVSLSDGMAGSIKFSVMGRMFALCGTDIDPTDKDHGLQLIRCGTTATLMRTNQLERFVLRLVMGVLARHHDGVEMMIADGELGQPDQMALPSVERLGLCEEGLDLLASRMRDAGLLKATLRMPLTGGAQSRYRPPLAF